MSKTKTATYDPQNSRNAEGTLAAFIQAPITGDLEEVPGIGPAGAAKLREAGVGTTFALFGKYLMLKEDLDVGPVELADRFYLWLQSTEFPGGHRAGVVQAIASKLNVSFPGLYDEAAYTS